MTLTLDEARRIYELLQQINLLYDETETKARKSRLTYSDLYNVMQDVYSLVKMYNLPPDVEQAIDMVIRLTIAFNSLRVAMIMLEASTPAGWVLAGIGALATVVAGFSGVFTAMNRRRRR